MNRRIELLCKKYTNLSMEDIRIIQSEAERLKNYRDSMNKDVFIDCPCTEEYEAVVVAECLRKDSPYDRSTVGFIVREKDEPAVFRTFRYGIETDAVEAKVFQKDELRGNMIQWVKPILNGENVIGVLIFEHQNEAKTDIVSQTDDFYNEIKEFWLGEYMDEGVLLVDTEGIIKYRNTTAYQIFRRQGYLYDIYGRDYSGISLNGRIHIPPGQNELIEKVTSGGRYFRIKTRRLEQNHGYLVIIRDITDIKRNEQELILKSTAIQEIHHRIKNNLQMIMSLLHMQKRRVKDQEMSSILQDTMSRIMSISMTHEILLSKGIDEVNLSEVINKLVENYNTINEGNECQVKIVLEGDEVFVNSEMSSTIALVVNELIQNCFKYAFIGRKTGKIHIQISHGFMGYANIVIRDDGVGFDIKEQGSSLGLRIVKSLVQDKCKGRLEIQSDEHGTSTMFDFRTK